MKGRAAKKVPGGKLVKVLVKVERGRIREITITGDFFLHPEEVILDLEEALRGARVGEEELNALEGRVEAVLKDKGAELIGLSAKDIAETIWEAAH